jgi:3',5'-cyclic AMP phosphodiesterase CpdA
MFFYLGDLVEYGFDDAMWTQAIDTMSPYTTHIMYRSLLGNHDTLLGGYNDYLDYCYPTGMEENTTNSRSYYEIVDNNVYFFLLDLEWGNDTNSPAQMAWLEHQLALVPAGSWIIVMAHAFFYSSGIYTDGYWWNDNQAMIQTFSPLFIKYHVQMVFSGHNHHLEALKDNGTFYFIDGGFGGLPDPMRDATGTGSLWYQNGQYGYVQVRIQGNNATATFYSPEQNVLNSFNVTK